MQIPFARRHKVSPAERAAQRLLPRTVTLWIPSTDWRVALAEVALFMGAALALSWIIQPQDPFGRAGGFPWLWLMAAIIALRYGAIIGVMAVAYALAGWLLLVSFGLVQGDFPRMSFLGGLILTLICGEFCDVWNARLNQAHAVNAYIDERLHALTHNHFLLALSHERLEQEFLARPFTLREMLLTLRKHVLRQGTTDKGLPAASGALDLLTQICRLESAALFAFEDAHLHRQAAARIGAFGTLDESDPMLAAALESGQLTHVQSNAFVEARQSSQYLVCAPMVSSSGRLMGVLVIERMPFTSLTLENLQFVTVFLGYYADSLDHATAVQPVLATHPQCPEDFALELVRMQRLLLTASIPSHLVAYSARDATTAADWFVRIDRMRRSIDLSWMHVAGERRLLLLLLPLTSSAGLAGYLERMTRVLREQFGVDFASAGLAVHMAEIDARPLPEQLTEFLGRCAVRAHAEATSSRQNRE